MKKLAFFFAMLSIAWTGVAQTTGTGVVLQTDSPYAFTPTTVDSTAVFEVELTNTVGVTQTVYFGGLEAPFSIDPSTPQEVPANSSINLSISFNPTEIGSFEDELEVLGDVFGSANLALSGQGIQVILDWTPADLSFETTAIGQQSSATVTVTSSGDGAGTISDVVFSNSIFSLDEANSTLSIDEGTSGDLTFLFSPTGAGVFNETVELYTNDPNNSVITIPLTATGISEVSGEVCDVTWSLADSPFTLVGNVTVPEGCTLTIEPGVVIDALGFGFQIDGDFMCQGTDLEPITFNGGNILIGPGDELDLVNLVHSYNPQTVVFDTPYELVYYNNFESSAGGYDFNCYDEHNNYDVLGSTDQYSSYGCDDFYRTSSSSYSLQSNVGDYYLRFYSNTGGNGYLYLEDAPVAPSSGDYEFSFTYESDRYERNCFMTIDVLDGDDWLTLYTSPIDIEGNSSHTRLARANHFFNEGEVMNFRIRHHNSVNETYSNEMYTYIDEVRIERLRNTVNEVAWDFAQNESDFANLISDWGEYGGEPRIMVDNGVLGLNAVQTNISFNTDGWSVAPIIVPEDGWYYIEIDNNLLDASYNTYNYWDYKSTQDNNSWYRVIHNETQYSSDFAPYTYDWRKEAIHSYEYLTAGSRIDFRYYGYYWTTSGAINAQAKNFRIYQLDESTSASTTNSEAAGILIQRPTIMDGVGARTIVITEGALDMDNCEVLDQLVIFMSDTASIANSTIESIKLNCPSAELASCAIGDLNVLSSIENPITPGNISDPNTVYYNNFESSAGGYDFNCYDEHNNYDVLGSTDQYSSYGCDDFYRTSSSSYSLQSNVGDYYLRFYSNTGGNGYLYLEDAPVAPSSGDYEFSFTYESDRYERNCFMTIDVLDGDDWLTLYTSPIDIEGNSSHTRLARANHFFNEGEVMNFRIRHHNSVNETYSNEMYTYIDEVRIERLRNTVNEVAWDFAQNESDFANLISDWGEYGGEPRIMVDNGVLGLNAVQTNISFNTDGWSVAPIIVPEDGWYYIEIDNNLLDASYNTYNYWDYKSTQDNNSWYRVIHNETQYNSDFAPYTYDWRKEAIHSYEYLTAGSRIDFRYYGYYWTTSGAINAQAKNFRIYQLTQDASEGGFTNLLANSCDFTNIYSDKSIHLELNQSDVNGSNGHGIHLSGAYSNLDMEHSMVSEHAMSGIVAEGNGGQIILENTIVAANGQSGITTDLPVDFSYITVVENGGPAWEVDLDYATGSIQNSILSLNASDWWYWGNEAVVSHYVYSDDYPQFQEGSYMLEAYSPCVDAAMPWNTDQNMPYGMGGLRADMGAYGGPNNAGWGGSPAPDGAATLQAASDSPQDQGYVLGLTFDASAFDNSIITDNISHYAVWRHYDPTGESIASLDDGNWELLGTMPAQGFSGYAYQAEALGNTNDFGSFTSCYTVVAHTDNEDVYWYSNVMCGEAVDNLAPENPDLNGLVLETGEAQLSWPTPAEEDYAYTEIFSDAGFSAEVGADTLVVDNTVLAGNSYTYTAVHYDVNGNASDAVSLTLDISAGLDVINLNAGWNLISIDRSLSDGDIETLFSGLQSNNLQYVTGFQNGVQFYDPNGLSFLNTMSSVDNGYGYWVKVAEDDVLEVGGSSLPVNYRPELNAGWNLIGYPNAEDSDPADYFADLIADDNLVYVTGFDEGSQVFDPNGLSFLNTLQELENGFGYWVKTLVGEDLNGLTTSDTKRNPSYMVLNGASSLTAAGETVDVLNASGEVVAQMDHLGRRLPHDHSGLWGGSIG